MPGIVLTDAFFYVLTEGGLRMTDGFLRIDNA